MIDHLKLTNSNVTMTKAVLFALVESAIRDRRTNGSFISNSYHIEISNNDAISCAIMALNDGWLVDNGKLHNNINDSKNIADRIKSAIRNNVPISDKSLRQDITRLVEIVEKEYSNG